MIIPCQLQLHCDSQPSALQAAAGEDSKRNLLAAEVFFFCCPHLQLRLSFSSWAWYEQEKERQCLPNCSRLPQGLLTKPCEPHDETCAIKAGERVLNGSTVMLAHIHCSFINTLACCCRCQYTALARACCYYNWLMDKNCGPIRMAKIAIPGRGQRMPAKIHSAARRP